MINYKKNIEIALNLLKVKYEKEYQFAKPRKFRFDYAIPNKKIAIEYEGLNWNPHTKSRHLTLTGYSKDCEKYNLAVLNGWKVLRYTAQTLTNHNIILGDLYKLLSKNGK